VQPNAPVDKRGVVQMELRPNLPAPKSLVQFRIGVGPA
jgi:hypothetical protein